MYIFSDDIIDSSFKQFKIQSNTDIVELVSDDGHGNAVVVSVQITAVSFISFELMGGGKRTVNFDFKHFLQLRLLKESINLKGSGEY